MFIYDKIKQSRRKFYDEKLEHYRLPQFKNEDDRKYRIAFLDYQEKLLSVVALAISVLLFMAKDIGNCYYTIAVIVVLVVLILLMVDTVSKNGLEKAVLLRIEEEEKSK